MEAELFTAFSTLGPLGVLAYLIYMDYRSGRFNGSKGGFAGISSQMKELQQHFNHETTALLKEILEEVKKTNAKHDEWQRYGIPTRGCKEKDIK